MPWAIYDDTGLLLDTVAETRERAMGYWLVGEGVYGATPQEAAEAFAIRAPGRARAVQVTISEVEP